MRKALKGSATALFIVAVLMVQLLPGCSVKTNSDDLKTSTLLAEDTTTGNGEGGGQVPSTGEDDNWSSCALGTSCVDPQGNKWYTDENGVTTPESGGQTPSTGGGGEGSDPTQTTDEGYKPNQDENTNWDNQGGGTEIADSKEVEKQKKDMEKNIGKKMLKEWERLLKREEKTGKRLEKLIEKAEKYKEKVSEDASATLDEIITAIESSVSNVETLITETSDAKAKLVEVQEEAKSCTENLTPGTTTWKELESAWTCTRKAEVFWALRDALDIRFAIEEMSEGTWEMKMEITKMESELGTLPETVNTLLTNITSLTEGNDAKREEGKTLYDEVLAAIDNVLALTDEQEIKDAVDEIWNGLSEEVRDFNDTVRDDMDYFWMDDPWMVLQEAWESGHVLKFIEEMKTQITSLSEEIAAGKKVSTELKTLTVEKEGVKKAIDELDELMTKVEGVLAEMQTLLEDPDLKPEMMEKFWGILDGVRQSAEKNLKKIFKYFENNEDQFEALSDEVQDTLKKWEEEGVGGGKGPGPNDKMGEFYGEDMVAELTKQIKAEVMEEVMRQISSELMESLAPYLEEDVIAGILNNLGSFSGDKGNALISNSTAVYKVLDEIDFDKLTKELKNLGERTRKALIVSTMKDALEEKWNEADAAAEADDTEEMDAIATEIEELLNENDTLSVTGEEAYQFKDVKIDENQWYFGSVMTMKEDGVVSGYKDKDGNFTGEFGPENNVSIAEALKMALEAAGQQMTKTDGNHWAESAGYVDKAKELGIGDLIDLGNLDKAATREEIAVIVAEAFELDTDVDYEDVFSDYNGEFGGQVQAVYDAEIFTGEGGTGNFNGSGLINRAAIAKVINYAISAQSSDSFIDEIDNFANTIENPTKTINTTEDKEDFEYNMDDDDDMDDMDDDDDDDDMDVDVDDVMDFINDLPDDI